MQIRGRIFTAVLSGIAGCLMLVSVAMDQSAAAADQVASPSIQAQAGETGDPGQVETRAINRTGGIAGTCKCSDGSGSCTFDDTRPQAPACTKAGAATCKGTCSYNAVSGSLSGAAKRARATSAIPHTTAPTGGNLVPGVFSTR
jgi:hypothetical protein